LTPSSQLHALEEAIAGRIRIQAATAQAMKNRISQTATLLGIPLATPKSDDKS
jgi:hypothetical protein